MSNTSTLVGSLMPLLTLCCSSCIYLESAGCNSTSFCVRLVESIWPPSRVSPISTIIPLKGLPSIGYAALDVIPGTTAALRASSLPCTRALLPTLLMGPPLLELLLQLFVLRRRISYFGDRGSSASPRVFCACVCINSSG